MERRKWINYTIGLVLAASGLTAVLLTRATAIVKDAPAGAKIPFALGLIGILVGVLVILSGLFPKRKPISIHTLTMAAMFAALCYVGFAFFQIKIPVGDSSTSFHLGNVFCVLAALCIGPLWGGLAGSVGMTIGDLLDPVYITSAPKTFLLKLGIGLISGFVAHKLFKISQDTERKIPLPVATVLSAAAGMAFNIVADPLVGYVYKMYVMGVPQDAASILAKMSAVTTSVNAVIAVIAATVFYLALRPALKRSNLLPQI
jgi:uncharacterized membrane protein